MGERTLGLPPAARARRLVQTPRGADSPIPREASAGSAWVGGRSSRRRPPHAALLPRVTAIALPPAPRPALLPITYPAVPLAWRRIVGRLHSARHSASSGISDDEPRATGRRSIACRGESTQTNVGGTQPKGAVQPRTHLLGTRPIRRTAVASDLPPCLPAVRQAPPVVLQPYGRHSPRLIEHATERLWLRGIVLALQPDLVDRRL